MAARTPRNRREFPGAGDILVEFTAVTVVMVMASPRYQPVAVGQVH